MAHNLNGTKEHTPGQNLYNELNMTNNRDVKACTALGIPTHNIPQAKKIIEEVLDGDELTLVIQTFGLDTKRRKQNDVADELGISPNTAHDLLQKAMDKLRKPKIRARLNKLSYTTEQLFEEIERLRKALTYEENYQATQCELEHRLDAALARAEKAEQKVQKLEAEKASLQHDNSRIENALTKAKRANADFQDKLVECLDQNYRTDSVVVKQCKDAFAQAIVKARQQLEENLSKIKPKTSSLALLDLTTETTKALQNRGIYTLPQLRKNSRHSLSKLRMSQKMIQEIIDKLKERGLDLRA